MVSTIPRRDRDKGFLSGHDKKLLYGELDFRADASPQKRYRMRRRIRNGIVDFSLLQVSLPRSERKQIFRPKDEPVTDTEFFTGAIDMMAFVYLGCKENGLDFRSFLRTAVYWAERERADRPVSIDVEFDLNVSPRVTESTALERYENGESLSYEQVGLLVANGVVDDEELQELASHAQENKSPQSVAVPPMPSIPGTPTRGELHESGTEVRNDPRGGGPIYDLGGGGGGALNVRELNADREMLRNAGYSPELVDDPEAVRKLAHTIANVDVERLQDMDTEAAAERVREAIAESGESGENGKES